MSASSSNYESPSAGRTSATYWRENEITRGEQTPQQIIAQQRLKKTQEQVDEVVEVLKDTTAKVLQRDEKVAELERRGEILLDKANEFQTGTSKLREKQCFQNYKIMIIASIVAVLVLSAFIWASTAV